MRVLIGIVSALGVAAIASPALAVDYRSPEVHVYEYHSGGQEERQERVFPAFSASAEHGATIALGDINGDGQDEVIVGAGPGSVPLVRVFTPTGIQVREFLAYGDTMTAGVNVAAGDLDGDGNVEIVTGTGRGAGPQVRVFDSFGTPKHTPGFFAYAEGFRGGVHVAVGNVLGGQRPEIITAAGPGGGPHVRVFNRSGEYTGMDFFPFGSDYVGGVSIAAANVDGGEYDELVTAMHSFGEPWVKVYRTDDTRAILGEFKAYDDAFMGGVNVTGGDIDRDGVDEVITSTRQAGGPHIRAFEGHGKLVDSGFLAYESDFRGGVSIAAGQMDGDGRTELVTVPQKKVVEGRLDLFKYIEVDLSDQTLRAYRNGVKEQEFAISSGVADHPTPLGEFAVTAKLPIHDYQWSYGIDHPDNYDIKDVPNNLRFLPHYYIHNAYWHNNFGNPMSRGCVNVDLHNSQEIYNWAEVGDPVLIQQ